jgi:hypothetical protein
MHGSGTAADKAAEADVLAAFLMARNAGRPQVDCYLAGIAAWRRHYPDRQASYAGKLAAAETHLFQRVLNLPRAERLKHQLAQRARHRGPLNVSRHKNDVQIRPE